MSKTTGVLGLSKPLYGTEPQISTDLDLLDAIITAPRLATNYAANAAITQKQGTVTLSKGSAAAMTLADPTTGSQVGAVGDDASELTIVSKTALAGGTNNTITLGGAIGDLVRLKAIAGKWFLLPSINATASHV